MARHPTLEHEKPRLTVRLDFGEHARLGPGKIALLERIGREGSISAAARALGMSYRRAWLLVDSMNRMFAEPVVRTYPGRARGGGAHLTRFGLRLIALYRGIERAAARGGRAAVGRLSAALRPPRARAPQRRTGRSARA